MASTLFHTTPLLIALVISSFMAGACGVSAISDKNNGNQSMSNASPTPSTGQPVNTGSADQAEKGMDGIEFNSDIQLDRSSGKERLIIQYSVKNNSRKPVLIFNQGDESNPGPFTVYIEPLADGTVEISKRGFLPPDNPSPTSVVYPGALKLEPGKSINDKVELTLQYITRRRPYASVTPGASMPERIQKVRFCLGIAPSEGVELKPLGDGNKKIMVADFNGLARQQLLCSEVKTIQ
jgi:hypothetical protein